MIGAVLLGWAAGTVAFQEAFRLEALPSPAGERSSLPALDRGADGQVRLSWTERVADGEATLLFSTLNEEGTWDAPKEIASGTNWFVNWTDFPSLSALADGTLLAHWLEKSGEGTYAYGVRFSLSNDGGETWSAPAWLHEDRSPVEHGFVSLVALDEERFGAVWLDARAMQAEPSGATALYFRTISANGELGDEVLLDERVCDCCPTDLLVGAWAHCAVYRDRSEDEVRDVSFVWIELDASEVKTSPPEAVHSDGWTVPGCPVNGPVLTLSEDGAACAWYTGASESGGQVLLGFLDADGFRAPHRIDDGTPEGRVDVERFDDGTVVVSWLEHGEGGAGWRLKAIDSRGEPLAPSFVVDGVSSGRESGLLRMARDGDSLIVAWTTDANRVATARIHRTE